VRGELNEKEKSGKTIGEHLSERYSEKSVLKLRKPHCVRGDSYIKKKRYKGGDNLYGKEKNTLI